MYTVEVALNDEIERKLNANDFTQRLIEGESHKIFPRALKAQLAFREQFNFVEVKFEENLSLCSSSKRFHCEATIIF